MESISKRRWNKGTERTLDSYVDRWQLMMMMVMMGDNMWLNGLKKKV